MPGKPWVPRFLKDLLDNVTISADTSLASNSDTKLPTEKAVKTYVDAHAGGGTSVPVQATAPSAPADKQLWVDTSNTSATYITANTTFYIKAVGGDYVDLPSAIADLSTKTLAPGVTVVLQLDDAIFTHAAQISWFTSSWLHGKQVTLQGTSTYTKSMTSVSGITGSVGAYTLTVVLTDVTNIAVGNVILFPPTTLANGTNPMALAGAFAITAVDTNNKTVSFTYAARNVNYLPSGAITGAPVILKSILKFTGATAGILIPTNSACGGMKNLAIVGNGTQGNGLQLQAGASIVNPGGANYNNLAFLNCSNGVNAGSGSFVGLTFYSSGHNGSGVTGSASFSIGGVYSCNSYHGVISSGTGTAGGYAVQNSGAGFFTYLGFLLTQSDFAYHNTGHGFSATNGSSQLSQFSTANSNGGYGFYADNGSTLGTYSTTATGNVSGATGFATNGFITG